ncbi:MAG: hypothetical protein ABIK83_15930 [Candidatus Zixiibacteriota bacterium]
MKEIIHVLLLTVLIAVVNLSLRTMVTQDDELWTRRIEFHENEFPYSIRPLTNVTTRSFANVFEISIKHAFALSQYILVFILFLSFRYYLKIIGMSQKQRVFGLWMLALSFPILCIHFIPNYSWDDLWAYIGLIWMAVFLFKSKLIHAALCLTFAMLSRENVILIAPAFFLIGSEKISWKKRLTALLIPIILYCGYRFIMFPEILSGRFTRLIVNFENLGEIRQTTYSVFISFGWLWGPLIIALYRFLKKEWFTDKFWNQIVYSAIIVSVLCIGVTLNTALARETRLFFTPFVFIIPLAVNYISNRKTLFKQMLERNQGWRIILSGTVLFTACLAIIVLLFPSFPFLPMIDLHRTLFALNLSFFIVIASLESRKYCDLLIRINR